MVLNYSFAKILSLGSVEYCAINLSLTGHQILILPLFKFNLTVSLSYFTISHAIVAVALALSELNCIE
jgi:hypothetical protein